MFPAPRDNDGSNPLPSNRRETPMVGPTNHAKDTFSSPVVATGGDTDVVMTDATASPPTSMNNHQNVTTSHHDEDSPLPPVNPLDGVGLHGQEQPDQFQDHRPQRFQPPLGRNASAGDTQPRLGYRQNSVGIRLSFPPTTASNHQPVELSGAAPTLESAGFMAQCDASSPDSASRREMEMNEPTPVIDNQQSNKTTPGSAEARNLQATMPSVEQRPESEKPVAAVASPLRSNLLPSNSDSSVAFVAESSLISDSKATALPLFPPKIKGISSNEYFGKAVETLDGGEGNTAARGASTNAVSLTSEDSTMNSVEMMKAVTKPDQYTAVTSSTAAIGSSATQKESSTEEKTENAFPRTARSLGSLETKQEYFLQQPSTTSGTITAVESRADPKAEFVDQMHPGQLVPPNVVTTATPSVQRDALHTTPLGTNPPQLRPNLPPGQNAATAFPVSSAPAFANSVNAGTVSMENGGLMHHHGRVSGIPPPPRPPGGGTFGGMKELRVEDALLYLDDVKREFGDRPRIYNEFLAIMKNFKSQEVDTPGVIARVSKLFRGYNNLILGFNKFLPDGFKISIEDLRQQDAAYAREQEILRQQQAAMEAKAQQLHMQREQQAAGAPIIGTIGMGGHGPLKQSPQQVVMPPSQQPKLQRQDEEEARQPPHIQTPPKPSKQVKPGSTKSQKGRKVQPVPGPQPSQAQPVQHQAVEFDHAISYVTTIKRRFANDPGTYHAFLEILHTYQKEQRGIKEVLEQVAHLFQDHPDLLKEFTFFLPDAVQEQAKERLHRAAAESESRLSAMRAKKQPGAMDGDSQQVIDMTGQPMLSDGDRGRKRTFQDVHDAPHPIAFPQTPESYVYNAAVERQFFDAAKEALASYTRDGGQAWAEFMKCLDMYAQEILSRGEMLNFVEPLLGKRNSKLFEEFKRILAAAGGRGTSTAPPMEDSWYSVPLSEIDFSRCRRCSPSYRALPRDYPAPPCSQRSDEDAKVLNDIWVSLPVGSEESYTFRHMRRNTYEETLFRCEDERFEIDMAIDSNLSTLALLEPFAEEMSVLSSNELQTQVDQENEPKTGAEQNGLGGKFFQYTFDPRILSVIHRNSIARIYGEQGAEMLELLKSNPSVAIPIVVKRLRQKDQEWRRVRDRLNRHWKELAEHNYYKSLDHRSLTWRTTDKRAISTRTLISEIKDRAANNGNEGQAALQARIDKAKEEHGSFYEVTMAKFLKRKLDLSNLLKPDRRLFTPHMSFVYENNTWVQRDAYRILSFALERGSINPTDKERCHRLWTEFLGPWFGLSLNWMLTPAASFMEASPSTLGCKGLPRIVSHDESSPVEDEEESFDDGDSNPRIITEDVRDDGFYDKMDSSLLADHHPLPAGSTVSTVYGEGRVIRCREVDGMYEVKLSLGTAILRPSAVLCSILAAEKSAYTTQRRHDDRTTLDRPDDKLVVGTQSLYLFFRLHQILCRRLGIAKRLAYEVKNDASLQTLVEQMPGSDNATLGKRRYDAFLSLVFALLDGGTGNAAEGGKYEDRVRSLLGHGGYELATMDKLISHILKNIQSMANDDTMWTLVQLFRRHADAGGFKPEALRQEAAYLSDGEQMYAFQVCPLHKDDMSVLHMEYLGVIAGSEEEEGSLSDPAELVSKRQKR